MIRYRNNFTKDTKRSFARAVNKKACMVEGCGRGARGSAAGQFVCGKHYQRWVKFRSFDLPLRKVPPSTDGRCTVDGCYNHIQSKNSPFCATHYIRLKRGSPDGLAPIRRSCVRCSKSLTKNQSKFCSQKCCMRHYHNVPLAIPCKICGTAFEPRGKFEVCSNECAATHLEIYKNDPKTRDLRRRNGAKRRAIQRGVQFEDFNFSEIFARDKWTCKICLTPVDRSKTFPHHLSPSIDHVVPLSKGGPHRRFNVQCAHWICNIRKSVKPMKRLDPPMVCEAVA